MINSLIETNCFYMQIAHSHTFINADGGDLNRKQEKGTLGPCENIKQYI